MAVVLPTILISAWCASRGSDRGRLIWLGALTYLVYSYVIDALVVRYNPLFLVYVALLGCAVDTPSVPDRGGDDRAQDAARLYPCRRTAIVHRAAGPRGTVDGGLHGPCRISDRSSAGRDVWWVFRAQRRGTRLVLERVTGAYVRLTGVAGPPDGHSTGQTSREGSHAA